MTLLTGSRVRLRALEPDDIDLLYAWENDPRVWGVSGTLAPFSREVLREFIDNQRFDIFRTGQMRLVICLTAEPAPSGITAAVSTSASASAKVKAKAPEKPDGAASLPTSPGGLESAGAPVGFVDLFDFDPVNLRAGVGILICDERDRRKGYAAEALELVSDYASAVLHLHQLYATVEIDNIASIELFRGAGFSQSGIRRDWIRRCDSWCDEILFQKIL
jgi:diamine N-acetyltransferase